jgi:hypothetical protein
MMIVLFPSRCFGFRLLHYLFLRKPVWAQIALQLGLALLSTSFPKNQKLFCDDTFLYVVHTIKVAQLAFYSNNIIQISSPTVVAVLRSMA